MRRIKAEVDVRRSILKLSLYLNADLVGVLGLFQGSYVLPAGGMDHCHDCMNERCSFLGTADYSIFPGYELFLRHGCNSLA